ncbi:MAG: bifunctional phosphoribosylaminoimidazolecarboxamide formyltransferase/IMP cyclohydrolase [Rhizobiales bacterium]|nr:bifunctional phosphoribosylaminoimidazolecarboxamide formyltransferase/IMP cyclohydrolase [Hyphomicrobiales bacterium]MBO6699986.1 bifunctional phosphoribosylaminoimidazolecarboxamide formyltransferase/IMP cyclohydrolase [Hyphomicrobiales bacterium]MBO6737849.1 bifunctional phosphoribosylaminoimidazolecarboxamide formyltransferase/IMP cyclohydrolase [Hyphomicrobiales bacterium]MBO6913094.1 bifunctional phosphoribosylaminoimidazolecarboxamide formyltransferase/IMP cyclohydrolase [Hyphomicrobia
MSDLAPIRRALLSVSDKEGLVPFAQELAERGIAILSTGGTARTLKDAGIAVTDVSDITGFPEIMDGRVKTLHPNVHGGLLAVRDNADHQKAMGEQGIEPIDLLVVNLYPFEATVAAEANEATVIENIDIGGPAMIRAAAKNHGDVTVVTAPEDYQTILDQLANHDGHTSLATRTALAGKAYARTAAYDAAVAAWFARDTPDALPNHVTIGGTKALDMRYGENPHQSAALYLTGEKRPGVARAELVQGKPLSFNNINDADAAFELASSFDPKDGPAIAIIKHANPCGVAQASSLEEAYALALRCDPVSAFGGIVAMNTTLTGAAAAKITDIFTEVIVAPAADDEAKALIAKKKNLRLLLTGGLADPRASGLTIRTVAGGFLVQGRDTLEAEDLELTVATKIAPNEHQMRDLRFAFKVAKHVKSNAIVYAKDGATVGVGAGQMNRLDSSRIAAMKAAEAAETAGLDQSLAIGSVVASDAFFPFPDGLLAAAKAGATAVIQPGGSMRDDAVIQAADEAGLAMVLTGVRHFRH